jgi:hypothetical protein
MILNINFIQITDFLIREQVIKMCLSAKAITSKDSIF